MTDLFNARFGTDLSLNQITAYTKNHHLANGLDTRFKPGAPTAYQCPKGRRLSESTEFKKGNRPWNYLPVGSERITTEGYVDVKIADPNKWKQKHHLIWEAVNGPIPKGHLVIFGDGNKLNVTLDNLILITLAQNARLNGYKLRQTDAELTKTAIIIVDLNAKIVQRKKGKRG